MTLGPRVPELAALELLVAVARTGSIAAAAREVGTTQQAASARLAGVEALTGVSLLRRTARGSTPTDGGTLVLAWATRVLEAAAELDAGLATLRGDARTRLRVSASLTVAEHLLPVWLVQLAGRGGATGVAAEVELRATSSENVLDDVRTGACELGFVESPGVPRGVRHRVVARDELVVVVRRDHPWARRRRPVTPAELAATALVSREQGSGTRDALHRALAAVDLVPAAPALVLSTTAAVRGAVRAGAGPAVLSTLGVRDDVAGGALTAVAVAGLDLGRALRAVWLGAAQPPAGPARDLVAHAVAHPVRHKLSL